MIQSNIRFLDHIYQLGCIYGRINFKMKTRRSFATISYNSDEFLASKLTDYVMDHKISWWCFINHVPDNDMTKEHKHLFIIPDTQLDTVSLAKDFEEICDYSTIPLRWMPCNFSKWDDWFLYCLHDKDYLKFKGLQRNFYYSKDDFISSDEDYFNVMVHSVDVSPYSGYTDIINAYYSGESFADLITAGKIPLHRVVQFATVWKSLQQNNISGSDYRDVNPYTGEIIKLHKEA